jgi:hypothetical protein
VQAETETAARPFVGDPNAVDTSGKHFSVEEHPYAFAGRLQSGDDSCEESVGMTFRNVKSLGLNKSNCEYEVTHDDKVRYARMSAVCTITVAGRVVTVIKMLGVSDDTGDDGETRAAILSQKADAIGFDTPFMNCTYTGIVFHRQP